MKYKATIGMEIHVELKTASKMFCGCKNGLGLEKKPNLHICPVCTAQPGTLPVPNQKAIEFVQLAGLSLGCKLREQSKFDRKNYFYPDIPKGYQISQYDQPLCEKGKLEIEGTKDKGKGMKKVIGITRIHLEEDTGKLTHPKGTDYTLVDFNRVGVPLMELVTEPDFEGGDEARIFCQKLQQVCRYLNISDADMEKGHMRCEANISLYKEGEDRLSGTKVEVKNINSFKFVEKAINFEIKRQTEELEAGKKIVQETRGWDANRNATISQRKKESAHDYRYFPEPDIPPMEFSEQYFSELKMALPEMPAEKTKRFSEQYEFTSDTVELLVSERDLADYFEKTVSELEEKICAKEFACDKKKAAKLAANYINTELRKHLTEGGHSIRDIQITPENYAEFVGIVADGKINSSAAQTVLKEMYRTGGDPSQIINEKNLMQMEDDSELEKVIGDILAKNQQSVEDFKAGKDRALQFLVGQAMKETKGKANPAKAMDLIKKAIV
jgi:aspartyl-tRNA(Asn)/glutamyl-tRNA(Gln) amidotransferase subunit B